MASQWYAEGREEGRVEVIDGLIRAGASWDLIETATGMDKGQFDALRAQVAAR